MTSAIVTGATGSIGVALVNRLLKQNISVTVVCRKNGRYNNLPKHNLLSLCFCELEELGKLNIPGHFDVFYHLAWAGTTGIERNNTELQLKNIKYTLDAVDLAERLKCKKFVGVGSQAEYGLCDNVLSVKTPTNPISGYGIAKLCAGQLSRLKCQQLGIEHTWVRVLSVYGKQDSENSIIKYAIKTFLKNEDASFSPATQIWDFLYSEDAAEALFLIGNSNKSKNKTYVLGSGIGKTLKEYIEKIHSICDSTSKINYGIIPFSDKSVTFLQADISDLTNDVGFVPKTSFSDGIKLLLKNEE